MATPPPTPVDWTRSRSLRTCSISSPETTVWPAVRSVASRWIASRLVVITPSASPATETRSGVMISVTPMFLSGSGAVARRPPRRGTSRSTRRGGAGGAARGGGERFRCSGSRGACAHLRGGGLLHLDGELTGGGAAALLRHRSALGAADLAL